MEFKVVNMEGKETGIISASDALFLREYNEALIHQVVKAFLANARSGTRAQKERGEVNRSTKKPFRQKGTGRARAGATSSPLWRGGGRIFPNRPDENFSQKINRKMYRAAILSILSQLIRDDRLIVVDNIIVDSPKTKNFVEILKRLSIFDSNILLIVDELTDDLYLASRNLPNILVLESHQIDPYNLLRCSKSVISRSVIEKLQEQWS